MPYGYVEELTKRAFISPVLNFFGHLGVSSDRGYCMDTINLNLPKGKLPYILLVSDIQTLNTFSSVKRMRLKTHYFRGRRHLKLEQKFPATVQGTYVDRRPGFYYKWDNNKVKINIRLGTTNYTQIEKQAEKLAHECNRFFMLYCL